MILARKTGLLRQGAVTRSRRMILRLPNTEVELYRQSTKKISFIGEVDVSSMVAFNIISQHFLKAWGFMWSMEENSLSTTILGLSEGERKSAYRQLARRECSSLRKKVSTAESLDVLDGLLTVGGESGKKIISEAYECVGLPPLVSFKSDLALLDLKNKVPMGWIVSDSPAAFNIHPAPPEKRGAGLYVPSLLAGDKEHGVTLHMLTKRVDDGPIIAVRRFLIPCGSTTTSLRALTAQHSLEILDELLLKLKFTEPLSDIPTTCHYAWGGMESTRKMVREMVKDTERKYGKDGHLALL